MIRPNHAPPDDAFAAAPTDAAAQPRAPHTLTARVASARNLMRRAFLPMADRLAGLYELPMRPQSPPAPHQPALQAPTAQTAASQPSASQSGSTARPENAPRAEKPKKRVKNPRVRLPRAPDAAPKKRIKPARRQAAPVPLPAPPPPAGKRSRKTRADDAAAQILMDLRQVRDEAVLPAPAARKRPRTGGAATNAPTKQTKRSERAMASNMALFADAAETLLTAAHAMAEGPRETAAARQAGPTSHPSVQPTDTCAAPAAKASRVQTAAATPWDQVWQACIHGPAKDVAQAIAAAHLPAPSLRTLLCRLAAQPQHHAALDAALSTAQTPDIVSGVLTHMLAAAHAAHEDSVATWIANFHARNPEALRAGLLHAGAFALSAAVEFNREAPLMQLLDILDPAISPDLVKNLLATAARFCDPCMVRNLTERLQSVRPKATRASHVVQQFLEHAQLASIAVFGRKVGKQALASAIGHATPAKREAMRARLKVSRAHTAARVDVDEIGQRFVQHADTTVVRLDALIQEAKGAQKLDELLKGYLADAVVRAAYVGRADILERMFNHADIGQPRCSDALRQVDGYLELAARGALEHEGLATFRQIASLAPHTDNESGDDTQQRALIDLAHALGDAEAAAWLASSQNNRAIAHTGTR